MSTVECLNTVIPSSNDNKIGITINYNQHVSNLLMFTHDTVQLETKNKQTRTCKIIVMAYNTVISLCDVDGNRRLLLNIILNQRKTFNRV